MADVRDNSVVGVSQAQRHLYELLQRVESGKEVAITRYGTPIARLIPVKTRSTPEQRRAAIAGIRRLAQGNKLKGLKIKDLISEGRL